MEIKEQLRTGKLTNAVMIEDNGITYPVFMETLHCPTIFDSLIESGYKYAAYPFSFKKDGIFITSLPVRDFNPSADEQQEMYDMASARRYNKDELAKRIDREAIQYVEMPAGEYTVNTRAEFLTYLERINESYPDIDYKPINFFVHPSALFTLDEFFSSEFAKYFEIIRNRRRMSYVRFNLLKTWLKQMGVLKDSYTYFDIMDAYFTWGIDGIHEQYSYKRRTVTQSHLHISEYSVTPEERRILKEQLGALDNLGGQHLPEFAERGTWLTKSTPDAIHATTSMLKESEVTPFIFKQESAIEVMELTTAAHNIEISVDGIYFDNVYQNPLIVHTPDVTDSIIPYEMLGSQYVTQLLTYVHLRAMAAAIIQARKRDTSVSSYKALLYNGADPYGAVNYILSKTGADKLTKADEADEVVVAVDTVDVERYVTGEMEADTPTNQQKIEIIEDIINGTTNIDGVFAGEQNDNMCDIKYYYECLYVAHYVLGNTIDDLQQAVRSIQSGDVTDLNGRPTWRFKSTNGMYIDMFTPVIDYKYRGFKSDVDNYHRKSVAESIKWIFVTTVARELGTSDAKRHVAFEGYYVKTNSSIVKVNMDSLLSMYEREIDEKVKNDRYAAHLRMDAKVWCSAQYFNVALNGMFTYPKDLGGHSVNMSASAIASFKSTLYACVETTFSYCQVCLRDTFVYSCVNAVITDFMIIPNSGYTLHEAPLPTLYNNYQETAPALWEQMVNAQIVTPTFSPWTYRTTSQMLVDKSKTNDDEISLYTYMSRGMDIIASVDEYDIFTAVPHMVEYNYPGVFPEQIIDQSTRQQRDGRVTIRLGATREVTAMDFRDYVQNTFVLPVEESETPIKEYHGLDSEDIYALGASALKGMLLIESKTIFIQSDLSSINTSDAGVVQYQNIPSLIAKGYPVCNVCGRKYVFKDMYGNLWWCLV